MKKTIALLLAALLVLSLAACSAKQEPAPTVTEASATEAPTESGIRTLKKVGVSYSTLANEFLKNMQASTDAFFQERGIEVVNMSAEGNAQTQSQQIENMITLGVDGIVVYATDEESVMSACEKAMDAGIAVLGEVSRKLGPKYAVAQMTMDYYGSGAMSAQSASEWVDKTFPDAEDGSIEAIVLHNTTSEYVSAYSDGMAEIAKNPKIKLLTDYYDVIGASDEAVKAAEYMDIILTEHPNVKVVMGFNAACGLAMAEVLMRSPGVDVNTVGVFGIDYSEAAINAIADPANPFRGTVNLATDDPNPTIYGLLTGELKGTEGEIGNLWYVGNISPIDENNVSEYLK